MDFTLIRLVVLLVIACLCGAIAQGVVGYSHGGFVASVLLGLAGAVVGPWIATSFGLPDYYRLHLGGESFPIVWSIVGAALLVLGISLFTRGRSPGYPGRHGAWR